MAAYVANHVNNHQGITDGRSSTPNNEDDSIDNYQISSTLLGRGGFAAVYQAICKRNGRKVAIKMIDKSKLTSDHLKDRVRTEVKIHSNLKHPNILELLSFFENDTHIFLVVELCEGGDLHQRLKVLYQKHNEQAQTSQDCLTPQYSKVNLSSVSQTPDLKSHGQTKPSSSRWCRLSETETRRIMTQLVSAVSYLHNTHQVAHRDLSLSNVLLTKSGDVKICDFGLACHMTDANANVAKQLSFARQIQHQHMTLCGTPNYISPEVASQNCPQSLSVDVWSLGCILFALLLGRAPFDSDSVAKTLANIRQVRYALPTNAGLSDEAMDLIKKLLERRPAKRLDVEDVALHPFFTNDQHPPVVDKIEAIKSPEPDEQFFYTSQKFENKENTPPAPNTFPCNPTGQHRTPVLSTPKTSTLASASALIEDDSGFHNTGGSSVFSSGRPYKPQSYGKRTALAPTIASFYSNSTFNGSSMLGSNFSSASSFGAQSSTPSQSQLQQSSAGIALAPLNATRLKPICERTNKAIVSITHDCCVLFEFVRAAPSAETLFIYEQLYISTDGQQITIIRPLAGSGTSSTRFNVAVNDATKLELVKNRLPTSHDGDKPLQTQRQNVQSSSSSDVLTFRYALAELPSRFAKKYQYAAKFVARLRSKTPKVTMYRSVGPEGASFSVKTMLMESRHDIEVEFCPFQLCIGGFRIHAAFDDASVLKQAQLLLKSRSPPGRDNATTVVKSLPLNVELLRGNANSHQQRFELDHAVKVLATDPAERLARDIRNEVVDCTAYRALVETLNFVAELRKKCVDVDKALLDVERSTHDDNFSCFPVVIGQRRPPAVLPRL